MKLAITRDQKIFNQFDLSTMCKTDGWITLIPDRKRNIAMLKRHSTNRSILSALVLAVCIVFGGLAGAQSAEPISPKLTSKLQDLLRKEMLAVNDASQEIITAIVTGNDERVATLAQQMFYFTSIDDTARQGRPHVSGPERFCNERQSLP